MHRKTLEYPEVQTLLRSAEDVLAEIADAGEVLRTLGPQARRLATLAGSLAIELDTLSYWSKAGHEVFRSHVALGHAVVPELETHLAAFKDEPLVQRYDRPLRNAAGFFKLLHDAVKVPCLPAAAQPGEEM